MAQDLIHRARHTEAHTGWQTPNRPRRQAIRDRGVGILALGIAIAIALMLGLASPPTAVAAVHRYPLPQGGVMERSLQTLRDDRDRGWQVVLFRASGNAPRLRVVGFPGVQIDRSAPIALARRDGWLTQSARDSFEFAELAPNTAEYALPDLGELLVGDRTLDLTIPLGPAIDATIPLPPFVIREWQTVIAADPQPPTP